MALTGSIPSLYVHFPFCESKCHYCDFYSLGRERTKEGDAPKYERALHAECARVTDLLAPELDTIFFGGGTPSMTPPESMERALAPLRLRERVTERTEWTMEANPSSVNARNLRAYRELGVNRISMGVQAMRTDLLELLGRVHSRDEVLTALDALFAAGFSNVSVDLLCGAPGQSLEDVESAMNALTAYPITHLSCYLLTLPPHHRMYKDLPSEDAQLEHLLLIDRVMRSKGFEHYEISNFAKPGLRARHNLNYWKGQSYLGLGPSDHSYSNGRTPGRAAPPLGEVSPKRWKNVSSLHKYASLLADGQTPVEWNETLNERQLGLERWMLALRLEEGFPESWLESGPRRAKAEVLKREGLLEIHPSLPQRIRLTPRGFALSDQVIAALS
jgi:oxygen-independent coproporphyrinogen-3 oxidase